MSKSTDHLIKVFIADDHALFRNDLKSLVAIHEGFELVGEAEDGESAWDQVQILNPDLILLDISMPGMNGLEVAKCIRTSMLPIQIILVSSYKAESFIKQAMDLNVEGYVLKDDTITDLPKALLNISRGETFLSPGVESLLHSTSAEDTQSGIEGACLDHLTPQELRVLRLMADQESPSSISKQLSLSEDTIEKIKKEIRLKYHFTSDHELLELALRRKAELKSFKLVPQDY